MDGTLSCAVDVDRIFGFAHIKLSMPILLITHVLSHPVLLCCLLGC